MDPSGEQDEWLMSQVALGRRERLEPLVRRYASPLMTLIQRMIGDRHRCEEVFQEVFLAVWKKRARYRFPLPFRSWLFAIAVNQCRVHLRLHQCPPGAAFLDCSPECCAIAAGPMPQEAAVCSETAAHVAAGVATLPVMQRAVLTLRVWGGLPYSEIAEVIGRSEQTARTHMHDGLAALRRHLEPRMR